MKISKIENNNRRPTNKEGLPSEAASVQIVLLRLQQAPRHRNSHLELELPKRKPPPPPPHLTKERNRGLAGFGKKVEERTKLSPKWKKCKMPKRDGKKPAKGHRGKAGSRHERLKGIDRRGGARDGGRDHLAARKGELVRGTEHVFQAITQRMFQKRQPKAWSTQSKDPPGPWENEHRMVNPEAPLNKIVQFQCWADTLQGVPEARPLAKADVLIKEKETAISRHFSTKARQPRSST